jgi:hypothetical protein
VFFSAIDRLELNLKQKSSVKKWIGIIALVLIALIVVVVYCVMNRLDSIAKIAIEKYGSQAIGTAVHVESVSIYPRSGSAFIRGVTIANPNGFTNPEAFKINAISVKMNIRSLAKSVWIIDEIFLRASEIFVEVNKNGIVNLNVLMMNLEKTIPLPRKEMNVFGIPMQERKFIIRRIVISQGIIHARIGTKILEHPMSNIELTGLGEKNGATPEQLTGEIMGELYQKALVEVRKKSGDPSIE